MKEDLKKEVIEKIKTGSIKSTPRWWFLFIDWLWWGMFSLSVLIGSVVLSIAISSLAQNDWRLYREIQGIEWRDILSGLPFFWLVFVVLMVWLAKYYWQVTRQGYKFNALTVVGLSLSLSLFIGSFAYFIGWGDELENASARLIPYYQKLEPGKFNFWSQPQIGLLGGEIVAVSDSDNLLLLDFTGRDWIIQGQNIVWLGGAEPRIGSQVKIIGRELVPGERVFEATEIRLWRP